MLIATSGPGGSSNRSTLGATIAIETGPLDHEVHAFAETPSRYLLEVAPADVAKVRTVLNDFGEKVGGIHAQVIAHLTTDGSLVWSEADMRESVNDLAAAWLKPLDW
jgi:selenophosphate synthetase-related protein